MVPRWLSKALLAAALVVMPFQGIAATLTVLYCHGERPAHADHAAQPHDDHGAGQAHYHGQSAPDDSGSNGSLMYHLCCNLSASMPMSVTFSTALPEFNARTFDPDTLLDLYDPEQLQRPPLA
jgi:hypothetical protein